METGNLFWLIEGYEGGEDIRTDEDLMKVWEGIYLEYSNLTDDNQSLRFFKIKMRLFYLETRIYYVNHLILQMVSREMDEETAAAYIDSIRRWQIPYRGDKIDTLEIEKVQRFLKLTKNEIGLKSNELEQMKGDGEPVPLTKQVVMAEQALGRNVIDPKTTSVAKWVYMMDVIRQLNEQKNKKLNGK